MLYRVLFICRLDKNLFLNFFTGTNETPTVQTIDNYMSKLHTLLMDSSNQQLAVAVRDIIANKLDIQTP